MSILVISKSKAPTIAKRPGPRGSILRYDFCFRPVCSRRPPGGAVRGCLFVSAPRFAQQSGYSTSYRPSGGSGGLGGRGSGGGVGIGGVGVGGDGRSGIATLLN